MSASNTLSALVHEGNGKVARFDQMAKYLGPLYKGTYALGLAPGGVVRQIEPAEQNSKVLGHDILDGPDRAVRVRSLREDKLMFFGPFKLIQGPMGAFGSLPVFLRDAQGQAYFWGYTFVTIRFPDALEDAQLRSIEIQGYAYRLWAADALTGERVVISASRAPLYGEPVVTPVHLSDTVWTLSVTPLAGWLDGARLAYEAALTLAAGVLLGGLTYALIGLALRMVQFNAECFSVFFSARPS